MSRINIFGFATVVLFAGLVSALPYDVDVAVNNVNIFYYNGQNADQYQTIVLGNFLDNMSHNSYFKPSAKTVFYYSEWGVDPTQCPDTKALVNALLLKGLNIFVVNYTTILPNEVPVEYLIDYEVAYKINYLGSAIANASKVYAGMMQNINLVHQIGFGLGAQVVSEIAHAFGDGILPLITVLDPIGWYRSYPLFNPINANRALNVQAIHTDSNNYGLDYDVGDWDFYVDAFNQTNSICASDSNIDDCLHFASVQYYTYSITNNYVAKKCNSPESCAQSSTIDTANMGYNLNTNSHNGAYYLQSTDGTLALTSY